MFKVVKNLAVFWPVSVLEPDSDQPGKLKEYVFEARFVIRGKDEMKIYADRRADLIARLPTADDYGADAKAATAIATDIARQIEAHDQSMFHLMVTDWRGIVDEADQPLAFTAENLDMVIGLDRIRIALNRAYEDAISNDRARLGN